MQCFACFYGQGSGRSEKFFRSGEVKSLRGEGSLEGGFCGRRHAGKGQAGDWYVWGFGQGVCVGLMSESRARGLRVRVVSCGEAVEAVVVE